jgi:hypothetical protein
VKRTNTSETVKLVKDEGETSFGHVGRKINDDRRDRAAYRRGKWRPHRDCGGARSASVGRVTKASGNAGMSGCCLRLPD